MISVQDIPQFPRSNWEVDVGWEYVDRFLDDWRAHEVNVVLEPDYQRGHVWTDDKRIAYIEYILQGGEVSRNITWNCPSWDILTDPPHTMELVDGLQRLTAMQMFMSNKLKAFGHYRSEYKGTFRVYHGFKFRVLTLATRADVLAFYLSLNGGGVVHTESELNRVRALLEAEKAKKK